MRLPHMRKSTHQFLALIAGAVLLLAPASKDVRAASETEEMVTTARFTLERFIEDPEELPFNENLANARGVLIMPSLIKGGLVIGAEGGSGVLLVKGSDGSWSPPAFYTLAAGSIGLQIGGEVSEVIFTLMSEDAVAAMLSSEFKLGGDISVAVAHKGGGAGGQQQRSEGVV